jgi:hypothetical protein
MESIREAGILRRLVGIGSQEKAHYLPAPASVEHETSVGFPPKQIALSVRSYGVDRVVGQFAFTSPLTRGPRIGSRRRWSYRTL